MEKKTVDVIIPTYRPEESFYKLLKGLANQTYPVSRIIVVNTGQKYYDAFWERLPLPERLPEISVIHITADKFDHGGTRKMAVQESNADYFVCMTQDAVPEGGNLIEKLIAPMERDENVAVSYARQLPHPYATPAERYVRGFNYPAESCVKSAVDLQTKGIKTFFCSNVCAAYRKETYEKLGGFVSKTIFNEDMIYAAGVIKAGLSISYTAEAKVYHSHNYTGIAQFHRNFDLAVSQAEHADIFAGLRSEGEGLKLVEGCIVYLCEQGKAYMIPEFIWNCACRYAGFLIGKQYRKLPMEVILKLTANPMYWQ